MKHKRNKRKYNETKMENTTCRICRLIDINDTYEKYLISNKPPQDELSRKFILD